MPDQDAQDINQMMSASAEAVVPPPKKSKFIWIVLGCVVLGVGLGVVVYQQSLAPAPKPTPTPRTSVTPTVTPIPIPSPSPIPSPVVPDANVVNPVANTITFPENGKIRVFSDINNITLVIVINVAGQNRTITLPNKVVNATNKMHFVDSTFEVTAGSTGTVNAYLNSTSGPKMLGWVPPTDGAKCGANGFVVVDKSPEIAFAEATLNGGTLFAKQCWADEGEVGEPSTLDFNDFFVAWAYTPSTTVASPSPGASVSPSPSPVASPSPSAVASVSPSPSPSPSQSAVASPSPRVVMPDTEGGVPVTGIFEVTVGTISVGLLLLMLGLLGLLTL